MAGLVIATTLIAAAVEAQARPRVEVASAARGHVRSEGVRGGSAVPSVRWHRCAASWEMPSHWLCAIYPVPLDYAHPSAGTLELAVARLPAADPLRRRGSVFFNPGGPGGAGLLFAWNWEDYVGVSVHRVYDLVTWDPRTVIRSTPALFCLSPDASARAEETPAAVLTDREMEARLQSTAAIAVGCGQNRLTRFVTTMDNVRDLDRLRQAVGDRKLSYVGISYGATIGAVYANVFPGRYRALVLHGVWDSQNRSRSSFAFFTDWAVQRQKALDAALQACDGVAAECALAPNAPEKYARLLARVRALALASGDSDLFTGLSGYAWYLINAYSIANRRAAAVVLEHVYQEIVVGHAASSPELIAESRRPPPLPVGADAAEANSDDVFFATSCSDFGRTSASWIDAAHQADRAAPVFGAGLVLGHSTCASWTAFGDRYTGRWDRGRAPILLLNQQWDSQTPLAGAQTMTRELGRAHLITISGWGHDDTTPCSTTAVDGYLLTGRLPTTSFCGDGLGWLTARLFLFIDASRSSLTAGQSTTLHVSAYNFRNGIAVHHLRTCLTLPAGLVLHSSSPSATLTLGRYCWSTATLPDSTHTTYTLTVRALPGASGNLIATATTTATGATVIRTKLRLSITPLAPPPQPSPPTPSITTPANGATYTQGEHVASSFSCTEGAGGSGIRSCVDQNGQPTGAAVDTATPGEHAFTVTATSMDGLTATASVTYSVIALPVTGCPDAATAFNHGFNAGFNAGFNPGFTSGHNSGFNRGFHVGFGPTADVPPAPARGVPRQALRPACDPVFNQGFNTGFNPGFNSGFNRGFNSGFSSGFNAGHKAKHHA